MGTQKGSISFYFLPQNSAKSANKRLQAKCMKYSLLQYLCYCLTNFDQIRTAKHIRLPKLMGNQKCETDGGQLKN